MRKIISFIAILVFLFPFHSFASDNVIRVINEDGSVEELSLPESSVNVPVSPKVVEPRKDSPQKDFTKPVYKAPKRDPKNATKAAEQEMSTHSPEKIEKNVENKPAVEAVKPVPESSSSEQKAEKVTFKPKRPVWPPIPGRKPLLLKKLENSVDALPNDTAIPEALAISAAIQHAPPSSDFRVLRRVHDNIPVYAVVFKTDKEPYTVLVDARNGKVIKSGYNK